MKKYRPLLILLNLLLILLLFNRAVFKKERTLTAGQLVLLELAPVDPRSLMQGDYMRLNYAISGTGYDPGIPPRGYFVVQLDQDGVATKVRIQAAKEPLSPGELLLHYKFAGDRSIYIGAESYFFEEGQASRFAEAKFGGLKVDKNGNSILVGLYDGQHHLLKP
ncbi:GDYXXLXY domain-containing protein [Taibaiella koreensis]|uniref:GDYXXLXY domain-containing protein n=1 Tax=Taibaiella koreensis TaxID=1268548 RepID=UPI000E59DAD9|nr:GDYXXLXY domain-containing protein [Taibaiella koreensis]